MNAAEQRSLAIDRWRAFLLNWENTLGALQPPDQRTTALYWSKGAALDREVKAISPHLTKAQQERLEEILMSYNDWWEVIDPSIAFGPGVSVEPADGKEEPRSNKEGILMGFLEEFRKVKN